MGYNLIGNVLSLPYMVLFFAVWLIASLHRPLLLACIVSALTTPVATIRKLKMFVTTVQYLALCNDKKFQKPKDDPQSFFKDAAAADKQKDDKDRGDDDTSNTSRVEKKTIIFIRHGESTWNDTFNRGDRSKLNFLLSFFPNLLKALCYEWYFFVTGKDLDSWFYDSPLSEKGLRQARGIQSFLANHNPESVTNANKREGEYIQYMLDASTNSILVSSNLRRAISTLAIGFQDRLQDNPDETFLLLPQLQEMSRNPDALCILPAHDEKEQASKDKKKKNKVHLSWTDPTDLDTIFETQIDTTLNTGNKAVDSVGLHRMQDFCRAVFEEEALATKDAICAAGHSLWFRTFFQLYLPHNSTHVSKKKKLINGGCVGFTLLRIPNEAKGYQYMIDPKSVTVLYGGF